MARFLLRRLGLGAATLALVSLLSWLVFATALNPTWQFFQNPHAPEVLAMRAKAHVDDPAIVRWWYWVRDLFSGKGFGREVVDNSPVGPQVMHAFVTSLELLALSVVFVVAGSVAVGLVAARRRGTAADVGLRSFAYVAWAVPAFLLALLLQRAMTGMANSWNFDPFGIAVVDRRTGFLGWLQVTTPAAIAVALGFVGVYSRYLRSALIVTLNEPYTVVARAKGLPERLAVRRYALRNALVPFVSVIALDFGALIGASLAADYVFGLHGLATLFLSNGLLNGDPFLIQAPIVLCATLVVVGSTLADIAVGALDPRIRLA